MLLVILVHLIFCDSGFYSEEKNQQKKQLSQLDETLNDFVIGNDENVNVSENEKLGQKINGQCNDSEIIDNSVGKNQVIKNIFLDQITRAVSSAVMTVENCMHDAILTGLRNMVIPRVELAVKLITGSTGHGTNSEVHNPDRRVFSGIFRNTPLMSASRRLDLEKELNRNDENRYDVDFEDGDFPPLKHENDRREHAHHIIKGQLSLKRKFEIGKSGFQKLSKSYSISTCKKKKLEDAQPEGVELHLIDKAHKSRPKNPLAEKYRH